MAKNNQKIILIIEDKISLVWMIVDNLQKEGFRVLVAGNGRDGMNMALKYHPNIILLDLVVQDINGLDLLHDLRKNNDKWAKTVPVVFLTDFNNKEILAAAEEDECCDYLLNIKWDTEDVIGKIKEKIL
ncbi:response regulator [Patescibacteria group bacterium]